MAAYYSLGEFFYSFLWFYSTFFLMGRWSILTESRLGSCCSLQMLDHTHYYSGPAFCILVL
jgi:hypothetical protein